MLLLGDRHNASLWSRLESEVNIDQMTGSLGSLRFFLAVWEQTTSAGTTAFWTGIMVEDGGIYRPSGK